jgi:hypothetical protein
MVILVHHTQLGVLIPQPPAQPRLVSPALLAALPPTATPRIAVALISAEMAQTRVPKWREAVTAADAALAAAIGPYVERMNIRPQAIGFAAFTRLLERELVARQQAAAQGSLSMLQMRCGAAEMRAEVRPFQTILQICGVY